MTLQEKQIYNTYLATTRSRQNKPFKLRENFNDFKETKEFVYVNRLKNFFNRYPHININQFFAAPYEIYPDTAHLDIQYYLTRPAIKAYSLYQKKIQEVSPDLQIEDIRKSFQFIGSFCLKHQLQLWDYVNYKTGCIYTWMMHYREHHINVYSLFEITDLTASLNVVSADERVLFTDDLQQTIIKFKTRYHNSTTAKHFVKAGTEKLKRFLKESLQITKK